MRDVDESTRGSFSAGAGAGSSASGSLIVLCALPFAAKQTEHLTGGGFDVPGSQSKQVSEALQRDFGSQADGISVLLKAAPGAGAADRRRRGRPDSPRGGDDRRG